MRKIELEFPGLRLGGTSWVIQGSFNDNLQYLSKEVSDMELVLFDTQEGSNVPSRAEVSMLKELCEAHEMSCTVHLPVDICVSKSDSDLREREDLCLRILELFAPLEPFGWILHIVGKKRANPPSSDIDTWLEKGTKSAEKLARSVNDKRKICIETLDYDPKYVELLASAAGTSICLDVGHLVRCGYPVLETARRCAEMTRVLHIHGVKPDGTDHVDLSYFDTELFRHLTEIMSNGEEKVMTIEVFEDDYDRSLQVIKKIRAGNRAEPSVVLQPFCLDSQMSIM